MSNAPCVSSEYSTDTCSSRNSSWLIFTGCLPPSRFTSEISVSSFQVLIRRSMRFMSSNTDVIAASPFAWSSLHNSTAQRVPMMASLRVIHSACAALGQQRSTANKRRNPMARARSKVHVWHVHGGDYAACVKLPAHLDTCEESRMKKLLAHIVVRRHRRGRRHAARLRQRPRRSAAHRSLGRARRIARAARHRSFPIA